MMGASPHQEAIVTAYDAIAAYRDEAGLPRFVGNQLRLLLPRHDGSLYQPSPDLIVHTTLGPGPRTALNVPLTGPPALALEVASPSPALNHGLDTRNPRASAAAGIAEYLVFDPFGDLVPGQVRAWRLGAGPEYDDWLPGPDGRWPSAALGLAFAPEGPLPRAFRPDGTPLPFNAELARRVRALERENAALLAELRRLRGEREGDSGLPVRVSS